MNTLDIISDSLNHVNQYKKDFILNLILHDFIQPIIVLNFLKIFELRYL